MLDFMLVCIMQHSSFSHAELSKALVVGSLSNLKDLEHFDSDRTPECDVVELRLDGLEENELEQALWACLRLKSWSVPVLITARCVSEGGLQELSVEQRCARLLQFAEAAAYVDIEIASFPEMEKTAKTLQEQGLVLVLSYHHFQFTPSLEELEEKVKTAQSYGADVAKLAVMHQDVKDLQIGAQLVQGRSFPLSFMGMGTLAPVSRLLYAQLGSCLNYGYLGSSTTAPGQWSAALLKKAIEAL